MWKAENEPDAPTSIRNFGVSTAKVNQNTDLNAGFHLLCSGYNNFADLKMSPEKITLFLAKFAPSTFGTPRANVQKIR